MLTTAHWRSYGRVVVEVVVVDKVVGVGNVMIKAPLPVDSSVSEPVFAPGVELFAPDRLATQRSVPEIAKAESRLK